VTMIGRRAFVEAVQSSGLQLDTLQFRETVNHALATLVNLQESGFGPAQ